MQCTVHTLIFTHLTFLLIKRLWPLCYAFGRNQPSLPSPFPSDDSGNLEEKEEGREGMKEERETHEGRTKLGNFFIHANPPMGKWKKEGEREWK